MSRKPWYQVRAGLVASNELMKKNIEAAHLLPDDHSVETKAVLLVKNLWQDEGPFIHMDGFEFFSESTRWIYQLEFIKNTFTIRKLNIMMPKERLT